MPVSIAIPNDSVAALAPAIVVVKTFMAKANAFVLYTVTFPDDFAAVVANCTMLINTILTQKVVPDYKALVLSQLASTYRAKFFFFHFQKPPSILKFDKVGSRLIKVIIHI